jgi:hypothetical protein
MTSDEQDFSKFHVWRKARQHVAEDFNVQALTYQISSLAVKASVPDLLEVGMQCINGRFNT